MAFNCFSSSDKNHLLWLKSEKDLKDAFYYFFGRTCNIKEDLNILKKRILAPIEHTETLFIKKIDKNDELKPYIKIHRIPNIGISFLNYFKYNELSPDNNKNIKIDTNISVKKDVLLNKATSTRPINICEEYVLISSHLKKPVELLLKGLEIEYPSDTNVPKHNISRQNVIVGIYGDSNLLFLRTENQTFYQFNSNLNDYFLSKFGCFKIPQITYDNKNTIYDYFKSITNENIEKNVNEDIIYNKFVESIFSLKER